MADDEAWLLADLAKSEARLLEWARLLPAPDAIVLLSIHLHRKRTSSWSEKLPVPTIEDVAPDASETDRKAAERLLSYAPDYGEQALRGIRYTRREPAERAMSDMRTRHPGFLDATYAAVATYGCFLSR